MKRDKKTKKQTGAGGSLGKALIRDKQKKKIEQGHAAEIHYIDEDDKDKPKLVSIVDRNSIDDFLVTAEMAQRNFEGERNFKLVKDTKFEPVIVYHDYKKNIDSRTNQEVEFLRIPRRPKWEKGVSREMFLNAENNAFLEWRRDLAYFEEANTSLVLTPFEKNIDIWRQLWLVLERSQLLIQIVDSRDPLTFRCADLERYIKDLDDAADTGIRRKSLLILNKSDLLSVEMRQVWSEYLNSQKINHIFFSAKIEQEIIDKPDEKEVAKIPRKKSKEEDEDDEFFKNKKEDPGMILGSIDKGEEKLEEKEKEEGKERPEEEREEKVEEKEEGKERPGEKGEEKGEEKREEKGEEEREEKPEEKAEDKGKKEGEEKREDKVEEGREEKGEEETGKEAPKETAKEESQTEFRMNSPQLFNRLGLIKIIQEELRKIKESGWSENERNPGMIVKGEEGNKKMMTVGLMGFPNVGKSSVINVLCKKKLVGVAPMPGKTKHLQTLILEEPEAKGIVLCDCPGLIFPSIATSRAEMVVNGILPIDKLKDHHSPMELLASRIPPQVFERLYNIRIPRKGEKVPSTDLLQSYAKHRGFFTGAGLPDESKVAKILLRDFVNGKLLYVKFPPGFDNSKCQIVNYNVLPPVESGQSSERPVEEEKDELLESVIKREEKKKPKFLQAEIVELMNGKTVKGFKLTKLARRDIKFAIKRGDLKEAEKLLKANIIEASQ